MQIRDLTLALGAALVALLSSACTRYGFERQELGLRHDAESDVLEVIVVSRNLLETSADSARTLAEVAGGKRHVILVDWPFEFPLEEMEAELRESADPLAARALAFVQGIAVMEAGVWAGPDGERSLYQRISVPRASQGLALANEWINRTFREPESAKKMIKKWEPRAAELFAAHVGAEKSWFSLEEGALVVRVPTSPEQAARSFEELLRQAANEDAPLLWFAAALTAISVEDGVATLTFGPGEDGWTRLRMELSQGGSKKPWVPPPGVALPEGPPPEIARFLEAGEPAAGRRR